MDKPEQTNRLIYNFEGERIGDVDTAVTAMSFEEAVDLAYKIDRRALVSLNKRMSVEDYKKQLYRCEVSTLDGLFVKYIYINQ